jgi:hypothetical protein
MDVPIANNSTWLRAPSSIEGVGDVEPGLCVCDCACLCGSLCIITDIII